MNLTISNSPSYTGYKYTVRCNENKKVPYLFNQVKDIITGRGIPAVFEMGSDSKIVLSPETKIMAHSLKKDLQQAGIKLSRNKHIDIKG